MTVIVNTLGTNVHSCDTVCVDVRGIAAVIVTAFLAEKIGRRYTVALEMFVCAFFVILVNICVSR